MKTAILGILMKFVSVDFVAKVIAACIAKLIRYASSKGGNTWSKVKGIMKKTENWIKLFNEVYEDDELTPEEEEKVAKAISDLTAVKKITQIVADKAK